MQKIKINKENLKTQMLPFIYDDALIVQVGFISDGSLYGYKNGELFFYSADKLAESIEISFLDTSEEVEAAVEVCNIVTKKLSANGIPNIHGITAEEVFQRDAISPMDFIRSFYRIYARYKSYTAALLP